MRSIIHHVQDYYVILYLNYSVFYCIKSMLASSKVCIQIFWQLEKMTQKNLPNIDKHRPYLAGNSFISETLNLIQPLMIKFFIAHSAQNGPIFLNVWYFCVIYPDFLPNNLDTGFSRSNKS